MCESFLLKDDHIRNNLIAYISELQISKENPYHVEIKTYKKIRSSAANSFYWASLTEYLKQIAAAVARVSDQTGYTPIEVKRLIAKNMQPEHGLILFAHKPEIAHEVLKEIVGIPTSTRLGTKEFMEFDGRMEQVIAEIAGEVNAFERAI